MGRPDPAGGEDRPERIECIDDRSLLVANHPHFLEIDADRRQIFRDIADVLVLGAAGQDLATDHQERGRDGLFGSGRICGCHDHLQENAPNDGPTQDGETRELVVRPYTAIVRAKHAREGVGGCCRITNGEIMMTANASTINPNSS